MRKLILVKHAKPEPVEGEPPERWRLSEHGRAACGPLADRLAPHQPSVIVASEEAKAAETAELVAGRLGVPWHAAAGLGEHDRTGVPQMASREFISHMELLFRRPKERVLGRESAAEALRRFESAVDSALRQHPDGNLAVVSHGTVLALMLAQHLDVPPFALWRQLGNPSFVVLNVPGFELVERVDRTDAQPAE
jgi:broad specificity phosphatase PhoE